MESIQIKGIDKIVKEYLDKANELLPSEDVLALSDKLYNHIISVFRRSKDVRETSGVNKIMLDSLRSYNGEYSPEELALIAEQGGSNIFMNLTSTKVRAAASWIADILVGTKAYSAGPTPIPELPEDITLMIQELVESKFQAAKGAEGSDELQTITETNEYKRDLSEAILNEMNAEANLGFKLIDKAIEDSFVEGGWDEALTEFIDYFCIFPTAVMKGPVISEEKTLVWSNGQPVVSKDYKFLNKNINPLDIYPSPEATSVNDGDLCEHLRFTRSSLSALRKAKGGYNVEKINKVLSTEDKSLNIDDYIEEEKIDEELRGTREDANQNIFHGIHFFGAVPIKTLRDWGKDVEGDDEDIVEVEAILVGSEVIKVVLNDDPLGRRPYYTASFQNRPGAFWGTSLPHILRDIQKMCNATARSLADNMALSSGPQAEIYTDRIASDGPIEEIYPRKIWEVTSDLTGGTGRAVNFFTVPSNAQELLGVYDRFEQMADDVSMVPKYAYSNENTKGSHQTFRGLATLLEGASKGIKGCIRRIDYGLIVPRVEYEFYHLMLKGDIKYTGAIDVKALGSATLTMKGAEDMKKQEFLQLALQPQVMQRIGTDAVVDIVRDVVETLGFSNVNIPSRHETKLAAKSEAEAAAQNRQAQLEEKLAPTKLQVDGQVNMHQGTQDTARLKIASNEKIALAKLHADTQKDVADVQLKDKSIDVKAATDADATQQKREAVDKSIAMSLQGQGTGDRDKSNI